MPLRARQTQVCLRMPCTTHQRARWCWLRRCGLAPSQSPGRTNRKDCAAVILYAAERATLMALDAIQILGGNGCAVSLRPAAGHGGGEGARAQAAARAWWGAPSADASVSCVHAALPCPERPPLRTLAHMFLPGTSTSTRPAGCYGTQSSMRLAQGRQVREGLPRPPGMRSRLVTPCRACAEIRRTLIGRELFKEGAA